MEEQLQSEVKKKKIKKGVIIATVTVVVAIIVALSVYTIWSNLTVETTEYELSFSSLPEEFDGFKIAQISDFHDSEFGDGNSDILDILITQQPDIIVITGDFVDSRRTNTERSLAFAEEAVKIAPCYYVTGNHESRLNDSGVYDGFEKSLKDAGVTVLRDNSTEIARGDAKIRVTGVDELNPDMEEFLTIKNLGDDTVFDVVLSHHPEFFDAYKDSGADLFFCGHAHGGQFRFPLIGGVFAPGQGFFPKYDDGVYTENGTTMVVSRGLGNSVIPLRINNRPEVVIAVLRCAR